MENNKQYSTITPEEISKMYVIVLKTAMMALASTTHQIIRTTGIFYKSFINNKAQLLYKKISCHYVNLYVEYLKFRVNSTRKSINSTLYTNKIGSKNVSPCTDITS